MHTNPPIGGGPGGTFLDAISFVDASNGWTVGADYGGGLVMATTNAGSTWTRQSVPSSASWLNGVKFVSATRGWAVGYENGLSTTTGVIIATSDGGSTWSSQAPGTGALTGVDFVDSLFGWAVGDAMAVSTAPGMILHTIDGGVTWTPQPIPSGVSGLLSVSFLDRLHGVAVGGYSPAEILMTADGGTTWSTVAVPAGVTALNSVAFARGTTDVWAAGFGNAGGTLIMSTDSGVSWTTQTIPSSISDVLGVTMSDATHGWAVGSNLTGDAEIIHTSTGAAWASQAAPTGTGQLLAVSAVSTTAAWATGQGVCSAAAIIGTTDGGSTWSEELDQTPYIRNLNATAAPDASHVFAAGSDSCGVGVMLASSDGGSTWTPQTLPAGTGPLQAMSFVSASTGWVTGFTQTFAHGNSIIIGTTDGGQTWTSEALPTSVGYLGDISFVDASHGWADGQLNSQPGIIATSDGGSSWKQEALPATVSANGSLNGIVFHDRLRGWAVGSTYQPSGGSQPLALATINGGTTWTQQTVPSPASGLSDVSFVSATTGWAAGFSQTGATIDATTDGGATWTSQAVPAASPDLLSVAGVDAQTAWAMGFVTDASGATGPLKTGNGGTTWSEQPISADLQWLSSGAFVSTSTGWTAGSLFCPQTGVLVGVIYHTTNGGSSWAQQYGTCAPATGPTVTAVSPAYGPEPGGQTVTLSGSGFSGATAVKFGSASATGVHVNSDTSLTAVSPPGTGTVDVHVVTPAGTSRPTPADQFTYLPAVSVLPAMSNGAYGGYVTVAYLKDTGATASHSFIAYFDQDGHAVGVGDSLTIPENGNATVRQDNGNGLPSNTAGSAIVYSDQPLAGFVNEFASSAASDATSYTAIRVPSGANPTLYAPAIANGAYGGYFTGIGLLNMGSATTDVTITYRDTTGAAIKTQTVTGVASRAYRGLYSGDSGSPTDAKLPADFAGTATITSTGNQPLAAIVNEAGPNGQFSSYDAVTSGSMTLDAPVMLNNGYGGYYTGMGIQNTGAAAGTVTVKFYDGSGNHVTPDVTAPIAANAYLPLYQGAAGQGPPMSTTGYTGVLTSTVPIAAIVNEVAPPTVTPGHPVAQTTQSTSYNTFPAGATTVHLALVENAGSDGWTTGLGVMNTGSATTHVTVTYYDAASGNPLGVTQATDLGPNAFYGPYQGAPSLLPPGTRATAVLTTSAGGSIAVVCNEQGANEFMSYDGQ